jgi:hypothetical protein
MKVKDAVKKGGTPEYYKDKTDRFFDKKGYKGKIQAPGYKYPVEKGIVITELKGASHGSDNASIVEIFGCKQCNWINSDLCPHQSEVDMSKPHANRICNKRKSLVRLFGEENDIKILAYSKAKRLKMFLDVESISDKLIRDALKKDDNEALQLALPWKKLGLEAIGGLIKQEEGSKLSVTSTSISPSQFQNMVNDIREEKIVDAEYDTVDMGEEENEKEKS